MTVSPITLAVWGALGTVRTQPWAAWRLMRVQHVTKGYGWACVLPDVWGRWRG